MTVERDVLGPGAVVLFFVVAPAAVVLRAAVRRVVAPVRGVDTRSGRSRELLGPNLHPSGSGWRVIRSTRRVRAGRGERSDGEPSTGSRRARRQAGTRRLPRPARQRSGGGTRGPLVS